MSMWWMIIHEITGYLVYLVYLVRVLGLFWGNLSKLTAYFDEIAQKIRPPAAGGDSPRPPD